MRVLFVTPEVTPYTGASPTGDTCWALPKALKGRGHEVTILAPLYGFVDPTTHHLARRLRKVEVEIDGEASPFQVFDARSAAGIDLMFLGHEQLFAKCEAVPRVGRDEDPMEDGLRFGAFCKGALEVIRTADPAFDAVHCHDWATGLLPVLVDLHELETPTMLTVHDATQQGRFAPELLKRLGLPEQVFGIDGMEFYGKACFLKGGVLEADRVTTASPTYAEELTREAGGLEGVFEARGKELSGITGGVDVAVWNPATDAHLESRFDPMDLAGKRRSKAALQHDLGLPVTDDVALIGVLGPLTPASGLDVLARIVSRVARNEVQLVMVGEGAGDESLVTVLREHAGRWPDRLHVQDDGDGALVHRVLGAADALLVPPHQAPGGSMQMRALRYGALPIGRRSGATADTVVDCEASLTTGNGFLYDAAEDDEVLAAVQRAIAAFAQRGAFEKVRRRAMRADHSWERSAYLYERLYAAM